MIFKIYQKTFNDNEHIFKVVQKKHYRMAVASRSHVTEPYNVIINDVGDNFIETYVPDKHLLRIEYPSLQWDYQTARMTFIQKPNES